MDRCPPTSKARSLSPEPLFKDTCLSHPRRRHDPDHSLLLWSSASMPVHASICFDPVIIPFAFPVRILIWGIHADAIYRYVFLALSLSSPLISCCRFIAVIALRFVYTRLPFLFLDDFEVGAKRIDVPLPPFPFQSSFPLPTPSLLSHASLDLWMYMSMKIPIRLYDIPF